VDNIVDKICDKLQQIKPVEEKVVEVKECEKRQKELRSVATEMTFQEEQSDSSSSEESEPSDDINDDDVNSVVIPDFDFTSNDTLYMNLPVKSRKPRTTRQVNTTINLDESLFSTTQYMKMQPKKPPVEVDLYKSPNTSINDQQFSAQPSFNDISCNTSMFKTLPEISSICSTPNERFPSIERMRSRNISNQSLLYNTANDSLPESVTTRNSTEFTIDTSFELSQLDNDKFWKDVFRKAGLDGSFSDVL